jgi:DNA-binding transcriptional MerR regulator
VPTKKTLPKGGPDVLTIKETATILCVSEVTLRRRDTSRKFSRHRHPMNGYRYYQGDEVLRMRRQIETRRAV